MTPEPNPASRLPLHEAHARAGAVFGERLGWNVPLRYAVPEEASAREYEAAREGAGLVDLSHRGLLVATGPQRQKFLHNILSNDIAGLQAGEGRLASLLTVKGHVVVLLRASVLPDAVVLEMPRDRLAVVEAALLHLRVAAPVRFQARPAVIFAVLGPRAPAVLERLGATLPGPAPESHASGSLAGQPATVIRASDVPLGGFVIHLLPEGAAPVFEGFVRAGAVPVGWEALDALRIEAGLPWYGSDVDEEALLHEAGLVASHHSPTKGCYIGQEVIARLEARGGNVNKRMRGLRLTGPVPAGTPVMGGGRDVGLVTSASTSPRLGPVALAYVHRDHAAPGTRVEVGSVRGTVVALPLEVPSA